MKVNESHVNYETMLVPPEEVAAYCPPIIVALESEYLRQFTQQQKTATIELPETHSIKSTA